MKIALFTTSFPSNSSTVVNAGVCVRDFAAVLTELGHEVEVLTPYKHGARHDFEHKSTTFFRWLGSEDSVAHIELQSPLGALQLASIVLAGSVAALRLVRRFRPDHVLCFWVFPCGLWARIASASTRTPYSLWALGSDIWALGKLPGMPRVLRALASRAAHRYADGLILAQDFARIAGLDVQFLATSRVLEAPKGVEQGSGGYFLYLGRYHTNKGIDLLIEALGVVRSRLPRDFRLRAHGFGPLESKVRARVAQLGLRDIVEINPPIDAHEMPIVLRRARGLIVPSRIESIPLVFSDALQMQVPLLVTDVGDMGQLVRRHGGGVVCSPDVEGLGEALIGFVDRPPPGGSDVLQRYLDIRTSARRFVASTSPAGAQPAKKVSLPPFLVAEQR